MFQVLMPAVWAAVPVGLFVARFGSNYLINLVQLYPTYCGLAALFGFLVNFYGAYASHLVVSDPRYQQNGRNLVLFSGPMSALVFAGIFYFCFNHAVVSTWMGAALFSMVAGMFAGSLAYSAYAFVCNNCKTS